MKIKQETKFNNGDFALHQSEKRTELAPVKIVSVDSYSFKSGHRERDQFFYLCSVIRQIGATPTMLILPESELIAVSDLDGLLRDIYK
jgi:hypothetical protein